jgi:hypothetical protein
MPSSHHNRRVLDLIRPRFRRVAKLRDPQRRQPGTQPRHRVEFLAAQLFRIAGGQHAARHLHVGKTVHLAVQVKVKGRVGAGRLAQQFEVRGDASAHGGGRHALKIDRDLGANDVETDAGPNAAARPRLRRQYIRRC